MWSPSIACCLVIAQLSLDRAQAGELLLDTANIDLLSLHCIPEFATRELTFDWLTSSVIPLSHVRANGGTMSHFSDPASTTTSSKGKRSETSSGEMVSRASITEASEASMALEGL